MLVTPIHEQGAAETVHEDGYRTLQDPGKQIVKIVNTWQVKNVFPYDQDGMASS